jgi:hypothetical protein
VLSPKRAGAAIDVQALPAGTDLVSGGLLEIDLEYSTTPSQTGNESGIGFKLQYDSVYFMSSIRMHPLRRYLLNAWWLYLAISQSPGPCVRSYLGG